MWPNGWEGLCFASGVYGLHARAVFENKASQEAQNIFDSKLVLSKVCMFKKVVGPQSDIFVQRTKITAGVDIGFLFLLKLFGRRARGSFQKALGQNEAL